MADFQFWVTTLKKKKRAQINDLMMNLQKFRNAKTNQIRPSRWQKLINITAEINEMKQREQYKVLGNLRAGSLRTK